MAKIAYPGDLVDGETITAAKFNARFQPLYKTLNATGVAGSDGITDDEIVDGSISASKINGSVMTLDTTQTVTGDKTFSGTTTISGTFSPTGGLTLGGPLNYGSITLLANSATPSIASGAVFFRTATAGGPHTITNFTGGTDGQIICVSISAQATIQAAPTGGSVIHTITGNDLVRSGAGGGEENCGIVWLLRSPDDSEWWQIIPSNATLPFTG